MLTLRNLIDNEELAKKLINLWEFKKVDSVDFLRSSATAIYQVKADEQIFYLRLIPEDETKELKVNDEMNLITYLISQGFNAVEPVLSKNSLYIEKSEGYYISLFKNVNGRRLDRIELTPELVILMAQQLSHLHELTLNQDNLVSNNIFSLLESFNFDYEPFNQERDKLLKKLKKLKLPIGVIHYDYEPDNLFFDEEMSQLNLIDFESAMKSFYMHDIFNMFEEWLRVYELTKEQFNIYKSIFLEVYYHDCPKFKYKSKYEGLFRSFNKLHIYQRMTHCLSDIPEEKEAWMLELIEDFKNAIESMKN